MKVVLQKALEKKNLLQAVFRLEGRTFCGLMESYLIFPPKMKESREIVDAVREQNYIKNINHNLAKRHSNKQYKILRTTFKQTT